MKQKWQFHKGIKASKYAVSAKTKTESEEALISQVKTRQIVNKDTNNDTKSPTARTEAKTLPKEGAKSATVSSNGQRSPNASPKAVLNA